MRIFSILLLACGFATAAAADTALERLETATETVTANIQQLYVSRVPALEPIMPTIAWDDDYRAAGECLVNTIRDEMNDDILQLYLGALEEFAARPLVSFLDLTAPAHPILNDNQISWHVHNCGTSAIARQRMIDSGFAEALMRPDVLAALRGG